MLAYDHVNLYFYTVAPFRSARLSQHVPLLFDSIQVSTSAAVMLNLCNVTAGLNGTVSVRSAGVTYVTPDGDVSIHCGCAATPGSPKACTGSNPRVRK